MNRNSRRFADETKSSLLSSCITSSKPLQESSTGDVTIKSVSPVTEDLCLLVGSRAIVYEIEESKYYFAVFETSSDLERFSINEAYRRQTTQGKKDKASKFNFFQPRERCGFLYQPFHNDFGPFNLAISHLFFSWMKIFFDTSEHRDDDIVVVLVHDECQRKLNAAYLVGSTAIVMLNKSVSSVKNSFQRYYAKGNLTSGVRVYESPKFTRFSDVTGIVSKYAMSLDHCFDAWQKALDLNWYNYYQFDQGEYVFCEQVEGGDLNWIVPNKLLAFCGPSNVPSENKHKPEFYHNYFKHYNVKAVIRLNDREYESSQFTKLGIEHYDLIFEDGSSPTAKLCQKFINIVDGVNGAVAIHCAAGLGRTGTLIAAYMISRYGFEAETAIAWIRICRPGSVIGKQQDWLLLNNDRLKQECVKANQASARATINSLRQSVCQSTSQAQLDDCNKSVFGVTSQLRGQAQGLLESKLQREQQSLNAKHQDDELDKLIGNKDPNVFSRFLRKRQPELKLPTRKRSPRTKSTPQQSEKALIIDLGKSVPFMVKLRDYSKCEKPEDITEYSISEAYHQDCLKLPPQAMYKSWLVKYPKNTYFKLVLMDKVFETIKSFRDERILDLFVNVYFCLIVTSKIIAFTNSNLSIDKTISTSCQSEPGRGGVIEFGFNTKFYKALRDPEKLKYMKSNCIMLICEQASFDNED